MMSIRNVLTATLLTAGAVLTAAAAVSIADADDAATTTQPPPDPRGWHHHWGLFHLLGRLNLSDAQKQQVKDILTAARPQLQSLHDQLRSNQLHLKQALPSDPNYASITSQASQTQGSLSAQLTTQQAEVRAQVYKVLTPEQQTQLAAMEAEKRR